MRICYLGTGAWGFALAHLLAQKGYTVTSWSQDPSLVEILSRFSEHPKLPGTPPLPNMQFTTSLEEALAGAEIIVESVTSSGLRPVLEKILPYLNPSIKCICLTSKGIETGSGLTLPEVAKEVLPESWQTKIALLSGPGFAKEVLQKMPTCLVASAYTNEAMHIVAKTFKAPFFRVYPNQDIMGVALGGALKNVIAIPCGFVEALAFGHSTKAALITRGLHEMTKLGTSVGAKTETFSGLSGLGDLVLTASSPLSRNYLFGFLLAQGRSVDAALKEVGMVVEGVHTTAAALLLAKRHQVEMPIAKTVSEILKGKISPHKAVELLMTRDIKEEHL